MLHGQRYFPSLKPAKNNRFKRTELTIDNHGRFLECFTLEGLNNREDFSVESHIFHTVPQNTTYFTESRMRKTLYQEITNVYRLSFLSRSGIGFYGNVPAIFVNFSDANIFSVVKFRARRMFAFRQSRKDVENISLS